MEYVAGGKKVWESMLVVVRGKDITEPCMPLWLMVVGLVLTKVEKSQELGIRLTGALIACGV